MRQLACSVNGQKLSISGHMGPPVCVAPTQHRHSGAKAAADNLEVNERGDVPIECCWQTLKCEFHIHFSQEILFFFWLFRTI